MKKPKGPKYRNLYAWRGLIWCKRTAGREATP